MNVSKPKILDPDPPDRGNDAVTSPDDEEESRRGGTSRLIDVVDSLLDELAPEVACGDESERRSVRFTLDRDGRIANWDTEGHAVGAPDGAPTPGQVLGDKWELIALHDESTFGQFYLGQHRVLKMRVGVKVLRKRFTATQRGRKLFHEEAMRVSLLAHPHIVKVFDYGEENDTPYLVMEFLEGRSLASHLRDGHRHDAGLTLDDGIDIFLQVTEALAYAHEGGGTGTPLAHLDLKPEHIFLEKTGDRWHAKVIDFGIAEILANPGSRTDEENSERGAVGTPAYMAPERFRGVADPRSDLYALGVVMYEFLSGRLPFSGCDVEELRRMHEEVIPPRPSASRPDGSSELTRELDELVLSTLEKDLESRPASARRFFKKLSGWRDRYAAARRGVPLRERLKWAGIAVGGLSAVLLALLYWGPWDRIAPPSRVPEIGLEPPDVFLETFVPGLGYEGGEAFLVIRHDARGATFSLGFVTDRRIANAWPGGRWIVDRLGDPELLLSSKVSIDAYVRVRGDFGRSVRSNEFRVPLDLKTPSIEEVRGGALLDASGALVLREGDSDFRLKSSEPLDLNRSEVSFGRLQPSGEDRMYNVSLDPRHEEVTIRLSDASGNTWEETLRVKRVRPPRLVSPDAPVILTSDRQLSVPVAIDSELKLSELRVSWDNGEVFSGKSPQRTFIVDFSNPPKSEPAIRTLRVQAWDALDSPERPGLDTELEVQHLRRRLFLRSGSDPDGAPVFSVRNRAGESVRLSTLRLAVKLFQITDATAEAEVVGADVDKLSGKLVTIERLKGHFRCEIAAWDEFGNEADRFETVFTVPNSPRIESFQLHGLLGSKDSPLYSIPPTLHVDPDFEQDVVRFEAKVIYRDPGDLVVTLRGENDGIETLPAPPNQSGKLSLSIPRRVLDRLLSKDGLNVLRLEVADRAHGSLRDSYSCDVYHYDLGLVVEPPEKQPIYPGRTDLRVLTDGRVVSEVRIDGVPAATEGRLRAGQSYRGQIEVRRVGRTTVNIELDGRDGRQHSTLFTYSPHPVEGLEYVFPCDGKLSGLELHLFYHAGKNGRQSFWYTTPSMARVLAEHFSLPSADDFRVSFETAEEIEKQLRDFAPNAYPSGDAAVSFLSLEEVKALGSLGKEWIRAEGLEKRPDWAWIAVSTDDVRPWIADRKLEAHHLRLRFPEGMWDPVDAREGGRP